jgi:hypothetical protein
VNEVLLSVAIGAGVPAVMVLVRYLPVLVRRTPRGPSPKDMQDAAKSIVRTMQGR